MRLAPCVLLPSSLMYLVVFNPTNSEFVHLVLYCCLLLLMVVAGTIICGDRLTEFADQPITVFLMLTLLWSLRRRSMVKPVDIKPPKPKQKPLKDSAPFFDFASPRSSDSEVRMPPSDSSEGDGLVASDAANAKGRRKKKRRARDTKAISPSSSTEDLAAKAVESPEKGLKSIVHTTPPVKKRQKKKKMSLSTMKENQDPKVGSTKPNMVPVLPPYVDLQNHPNFKGKDLYDEFSKHILSPSQLARNDYPLEDPDNPGHIVVRVKTFNPSPTSRICSRCGHTFEIVNGRYFADTNCFFHPTRVVKEGRHDCCGEISPAKGCNLGISHVNPDLPLEEFIFKKTELKKQVKADQLRKVFSLDCEMVYTTLGFEVAKVTLVDVQGKPVYDTLVRTQHRVTDHNTMFSGIHRTDLDNVNITLEDVQAFLLKTITKDTILVGHALQNDLKCLRIIHERVVDTQVVFRQQEDRHRKKLKWLASTYLNQTIQNGKTGHSSLEDSRACMELMLTKIYSDISGGPLKVYDAEDHKENTYKHAVKIPPPLSYTPLQPRMVYAAPFTPLQQTVVNVPSSTRTPLQQKLAMLLAPQCCERGCVCSNCEWMCRSNFPMPDKIQMLNGGIFMTRHGVGACTHCPYHPNHPFPFL